MSDRALQDDLIRALADAPYRASAAWRSRRLADPARLDRFARFLARHYYHERIVHFFKYSRALARVTGRRPESVLARPAFEALLPTMVLGSRDTAQRVARLVADHVVDGDRGPVPYLGDLLRYEHAMMVVEAGPRVWRDPVEPAKAVGRGARGVPVPVEGTAFLELAYDLPAVLPRLLQIWRAPPEAPARPTKLLVARSPHGRVAVARSIEPVERLLALADGHRTVADLVAQAGLAPGELEDALRGLVELGAVRFTTGS